MSMEMINYYEKLFEIQEIGMEVQEFYNIVYADPSKASDPQYQDIMNNFV